MPIIGIGNPVQLIGFFNRLWQLNSILMGTFNVPGLDGLDDTVSSSEYILRNAGASDIPWETANSATCTG